jgi:NADH dehydrogenase FAD-containing subunit
VLLEGGAAVEYDWLVVALGAESDPRGVPGVRELATAFVGLEDAQRVDARLAELEGAAAAGGGAAAAPVVAVVGAGYAGVELATVLGERVQGRGVAVKVVTPTGDVLPGSPEGQRAAARKALNSLGVELITGVKVQRLSAADNGGGGGGEGERGGVGRCVVHVEDASGEAGAFEADLVVWTAGLAPASKFVKVSACPPARRQPARRRPAAVGRPGGRAHDPGP